MLEFSIMVAVITGVVEVIKRATGLSTRYIPLLAVVLGVVYAVVFGDLSTDVAFQGLIAGLSSVGLYRTGQKLSK